MLILGLMQISMEGAFPASGFAVMNGALTDAMCVAAGFNLGSVVRLANALARALE